MNTFIIESENKEKWNIEQNCAYDMHCLRLTALHVQFNGWLAAVKFDQLPQENPFSPERPAQAATCLIALCQGEAGMEP